MSTPKNQPKGNSAMPNSVTIAGQVFTDPRILAIHAKAIADSFPEVKGHIWPSRPFYLDSEIISVSEERAIWIARKEFWKLQGDVLGSIAAKGC